MASIHGNAAPCVLVAALLCLCKKRVLQSPTAVTDPKTPRTPSRGLHEGPQSKTHTTARPNAARAHTHTLTQNPKMCLWSSAIVCASTLVEGVCKFDRSLLTNIAAEPPAMTGEHSHSVGGWAWLVGWSRCRPPPPLTRAMAAAMAGRMGRPFAIKKRERRTNERNGAILSIYQLKKRRVPD